MRIVVVTVDNGENRDYTIRKVVEVNKVKSYQITEWCHSMIKMQVPSNGIYIDATAGNGYDTLFLCQVAGESGMVYAFDIQEQAIINTKNLLEKHGMQNRADVILDSHIHMESYILQETVDCICFNFGYLPGGDHLIATEAETSLLAVKQGLRLLKKGGMMSLCIYSGGDTGFKERDILLEYLKELDGKKYIVILNSYYNHKNNPPIPVFIFKKQ